MVGTKSNIEFLPVHLEGFCSPRIQAQEGDVFVDNGVGYMVTQFGSFDDMRKLTAAELENIRKRRRRPKHG